MEKSFGFIPPKGDDNYWFMHACIYISQKKCFGTTFKAVA